MPNDFPMADGAPVHYLAWRATPGASSCLCLVGGDSGQPDPAWDALAQRAWRAARRGDHFEVADAFYEHDGAARQVLVAKVTGPVGGPTLRRLGWELGRRISGDDVELRCTGLAGADPYAPLLEGIVTGRITPERGLAAAVLAIHIDGEQAEAIVSRADAVGHAINTARRLAILPPSTLTPQRLAEIAVSVAKSHDLDYDVLTADELCAKGYGGLTAVGAGSAHPPLLAHLRYEPRPGQAPVAIVGKGITFDSGGLQIKTGNLEWMKYDMAGGAIALLALDAACRLGIQVNVDLVLPIAENMPGPGACRPGDVITHLDGSTTEVTFTDAEGRLILADAITHALRRSPKAIVDIATLTDPFQLGDQIIGLCSNRDELAAALTGAAARAGEPMFRLPLWPGYEEWLETPIATRRNWAPDRAVAGMPTAGTTLAGLFLQQFVADTPWAHLDIAATALHRAPAGPWPSGASGSGLSTLVGWLESQA